MSKSKGDFLTISLLEEKGFLPLSYRFMCLQSHYHKTLVFSYDALENAENSYKKLLNKIRSLKDTEEPIEGTKIYEDKFREALENDLNTADAITVLYDVLKSSLNDSSKKYLIKKFDQVLSLDLLKEEKIDKNLEQYILEKIEERKKAKLERNFALADQIREELESKNIYLKDTREGTTFEIK
jgi:cysteinyl-tRNA synthetase